MTNVLVRRFAATVVTVGLVAACSGSGAREAATSDEGWWESEAALAPGNFDVVVDEPVDEAGGSVAAGGTEVAVPAGTVSGSVDVSIREPLGSFGGERGGAIVGIDHDDPLAGPVTVRWDVAGLSSAEQDTLLLVRWNERQQRWVPGDVDPVLEDGVVSAELSDWSNWSWVANAGQAGQEVIGRRAAAPVCGDGPLHDWVGGVVDPDAGSDAAAVRVCFENDRDEIVTMRVVNNRTFGQFIHVDGAAGWEWVWNGEDELSAVQAVRTGAAALFNGDRRIFVPPLHEVAVGIGRPDVGGAHFIEFRNETSLETLLADVVLFAVSKINIPGPGVERVGVLVEAVLECAVSDVLVGGGGTDLESVAGLVVEAVTSCVGEITNPTSELGLAFRTTLSERIAAFPNAADAADAMRNDRLLRSVSRVLRLLSVVEAVTYLGDVAAETLVGDLRWSLRGMGANAPLGAWTPDCGDVARDSNLLYRNLALQDEFADTNVEYHEFPRWAVAAREAVVALDACDSEYLAGLAKAVRDGWGDRVAAGVVADAVDRVAAGPVPVDSTQVESVILSGEHCDGRRDVQLVGGISESVVDEFPTFVSVASGDGGAAYGDVDGDGVGDALFFSACSPGGNSVLSALHVLFAGDWRTVPVVFGAGVASEWEFQAVGVEITGGDVLVRYGAADEFDPHCCRSIDVTETLRYGNGAFARVGLSEWTARDSAALVVGAINARDRSPVADLISADLFAAAVAHRDAHGVYTSCTRTFEGAGGGSRRCLIGTEAGWADELTLEHVGFARWRVTDFQLVGGGA